MGLRLFYWVLTEVGAAGVKGKGCQDLITVIKNCCYQQERITEHDYGSMEEINNARKLTQKVVVQRPPQGRRYRLANWGSSRRIGQEL